jgi:hypothetical protein
VERAVLMGMRRDLRAAPGRAVTALLAVLAAFALACGGGPRDARQGASPGAGQGAPAKASAVPGGGVAVIVVPSVPSRTSPPAISVRCPPGKGARILGVEWYVNGTDQGADVPLPAPRFQRGDRIYADVKLETGPETVVLKTNEVTAGNGVPAVTDVRIEPQAPVSGGTVRAVVEAGDPDDDPVAFRYQWYVNDRQVSGSSDSIALQGVKRGSWVRVSVTPNDGADDGIWKSSPKYEVVNAPPVVKSKPPTTVPPSRLLRHTIVAEDPDGDPLTFALLQGPPGMEIHGATLEWTVGDEYIGKTVDAVIEISDGHGGKTDETLSMTIRRN